MALFTETFLLLAALLIDAWIGNCGFFPCLTAFMLFHAAECVSVRYAVVMSLVTGLAADLLYCRSSTWALLVYPAVLLLGRAALIRRDVESACTVADVLLPGAAAGAALELAETFFGTGDVGRWSWWVFVSSSIFGVVSGALKMIVVLALADMICGYLGTPRFFRPARSRLAAGSGNPRRRVHRVRASNMVRRNR